ncbi:MAG: sulfate transporter family protein [Methylocystis sp.]
MLDAALASLRQILTKPFRSVLYKSLGLTLLLLALAWAGLDKLALSIAVVDHPLLRAILVFATGAGLVVVLAFLIGPISILVAGFFVDDLAAIVEREIYPEGHIGKPAPTLDALTMTLRFSLVSAGVNLVALMLLFVPGVNAVAFLLANAYLFGREYFALAATRFRTPARADDLRQRNSGKIFFAGLFIAGFVMTPGLNLLTPLFGTAFMVRVHKMLSPDLA